MNTIYKLINNITGELYIGKTERNFEIRKDEHTKGNQLVDQKIKEYGVENFTFEMLYEGNCTPQELNEKEIQYIKEYDCVYPKGYNKTFGGDGVSKGMKLSEETKRKMSISRTGLKRTKQARKNMSVAQKKRYENTENRKKISNTLKGKKLSEERKKNISIAVKKYYENPENRKKASIDQTGKKHSEETKKKISNTMKGRI